MTENNDNPPAGQLYEELTSTVDRLNDLMRQAAEIGIEVRLEQHRPPHLDRMLDHAEFVPVNLRTQYWGT